MAAILYDFPGVPGDTDTRLQHPRNRPWKDVRYLGIYEDLTARDLPVPTVPASQIDRPMLIAHLQALLGEVVRAELAADPAGVYKHADTHEHRAKMFSEHQYDVNKREIPSRLSRVLAGFPHGPNVLTAEHIAAALGSE